LFIASLGNETPDYRNCNHNAGHLLLDALSDLLGVALPSELTRIPYGGEKAKMSSLTRDWLLWRNPRSMNVSGRSLGPSWRAFQGSPNRENARLIVLHDELEESPGTVVVSRFGSQRGHKGLASINPYLHHSIYFRIGIGIGRPESRDRHDVSQYVLKTMPTWSQKRLRTETAPLVLKLLQWLA
ncbi:peptidyl-tRNA hydrolase, partial [Saccharata proteae CBS 121410]